MAPGGGLLREGGGRRDCGGLALSPRVAQRAKAGLRPPPRPGPSGWGGGTAGSRGLGQRVSGLGLQVPPGGAEPAPLGPGTGVGVARAAGDGTGEGVAAGSAPGRRGPAACAAAQAPPAGVNFKLRDRFSAPCAEVGAGPSCGRSDTPAARPPQFTEGSCASDVKQPRYP